MTAKKKDKPLTARQKLDTCAKIENEGFDYYFLHYTDGNDSPDEHYKKLIANFRTAAQELDRYIGFDAFLNGDNDLRD